MVDVEAKEENSSKEKSERALAEAALTLAEIGTCFPPSWVYVERDRRC
jgi:hypothetical protein